MLVDFSECILKVRVSDQISVFLVAEISAWQFLLIDFQRDAVSAFYLLTVGYSPKQRKLSIKYRCKQNGHILLASIGLVFTNRFSFSE